MSDLYTMSPSKIVMYTTRHCGDCHRAKAYFESNEIEYLESSIEGDEAGIEFVTSINNGYRSVPTIIFPDGSVLVEPNIQELREKFAPR